MVRLVACLPLLLIAATPSPSHHHQAQQTKAPAEQRYYTPSPIATPSNQSSSKPTATESRNYTYNYYYPSSKSESPPVWFQEVTAFILLLFTGGLWWTSIQQWRAMKDQADIANLTLKSTQRTDAALLMLNRVSVHFHKENDPGEIDYVRFEWGVKNYGRSPAIIEDRAAWICAVTHLPPTPDYSRTLAHPQITEIAHEVFVGEQQESVMSSTIDPNVFAGEKGNDLYETIYGGPSIIYVGKEIDPEAMHLIFYGRLRYTDIFGQEHLTGFCYRWIPNTERCQRFGGHAYNYTT